jgi:hypothetical protein
MGWGRLDTPCLQVRWFDRSMGGDAVAADHFGS